MGGDTVGNAKLKIGELAMMSGVTKRTVDHYTVLGLLAAERTASNYRLYDPSMLERIRWIEEHKAAGKSLEQIRILLKVDSPVEVEVDIQEIRLQMRRLEKEVAKLVEQMDEKQRRQLKKKVSPESAALMHSLILLLS
ncbi:MerR family transcriptional regulator [Cohnella hongkongensis]|uniref:MerR family transcriptional regulator n=1 Tax=Cohnella hongkongensis TaxID=178337 RepID=A0ABV9F985_9BACL